MEINTTIGEFPEAMKPLKHPANTPIRVIIEFPLEAGSSKVKSKQHKSKYPFLHSGFWEGEDTPTDLAEHHDKYLYDEE